MDYKILAAAAALALVPVAFGCGGETTRNDGPIIIADEPDADDNSSNDVDAGHTADAAHPEEDAEHFEPDADVAAPEDVEDEEDIEQDPCGNGVIDPGETCDGNCPVACDDGNGCTEGTLMGDPEMCTSTCEYEPIVACEDYEGDYSGRYFIQAEEKVGNSVIHSIKCTGTFEATVDVSRENHLEGTAECHYPGSVGAFKTNQTATFTGGIAADGTFTGRLVHDFGTQNNGSFPINGTLSNGLLTVDNEGAFRPHPQTAFPWEVVIELGDL
ncbi:MAG: hypothetical protein ACNA8W_22885 [Bradymonadaceae bacterium]